jgi:hypothetical protein
MHGLTCPTKLEAGRTGRMKTIAVIAAATLLLAGCNAPKGGGGSSGGGGGGGGGSSGKAPKQGQGQQVDLVWHPAPAPGYWKVKLNHGQEEDPATATTKLDPDVGPTMFTVDISGAATFKDPGGLDVWEGANAKSQPQSGINSTQVLEPIVTKNGKRLIFFDLNYGSRAMLNYRLNFNNGVPSVDPIIDNGGGNW